MAGRPFPGWYVVAAVFLVLSATSGLIFYGLAIYLDALTDEQAFSTTSVSLATSVFFVVGGVAGRVIAPLIERHDIRIVMGAGGVLATISLYLLGQVTSIVALYAVYIAMAIGFALVGLLPGTTLVTRWFHERRALALAVASTGLSFGGLTYTIFAAWLIDDRGLRDAAPILAAVFFVSVLVAMPGLWPSPAIARPDTVRRGPGECRGPRWARLRHGGRHPLLPHHRRGVSSWPWAHRSAPSARSRISAPNASTALPAPSPSPRSRWAACSADWPAARSPIGSR